MLECARIILTRDETARPLPGAMLSFRGAAPAPACQAGPVKYVLFYKSADDVRAKAPAHFAAHKAWYEQFHARGDLLMLGTFEDAQQDGAMSVFRTREAAEEFAAGDPFVLNGVVRSWHVHGWNEALIPD